MTPAAILRWHRTLARRRRRHPKRRPGRPPIEPATRQLILRIARENPRCSYQRISGELRKLGVAVVADDVQKPVRQPLRRARLRHRRRERDHAPTGKLMSACQPSY